MGVKGFYNSINDRVVEKHTTLDDMDRFRYMICKMRAK
jgi:hypothetical protein